MDSITERRRAEIMEQLQRRELVKVADLSRSLGISEVSIRRDLQALQQQGLLKRVHGGAIPSLNRSQDGRLSGAADPSTEKKRRIGKAAAELINCGDRLIFDSGTTPLHVASQIVEDLLRDGNLTVITASMPIVRQLGACKGLHLIVLGGLYVPQHEVLVGPQAVDSLKNLHANKMFLGTDGLTFSQGLTTANVLEAEVERAMVRATSEVIAVADSSKIGKIGLANIMPITDLHRLITDSEAPPDFVARLRDHGVDVVLV